MNMDNLSLCPPAFLYILFSMIFTIVLSLTNVYLHSMLFHLFVVAIWTFMLQYLCESKFTSMAWILLIFPLFLVFIFFIFYIYITNHATPVVYD